MVSTNWMFSGLLTILGFGSLDHDNDIRRSGCGRTQWFPGTTRYFRLRSSSRMRDFSVHIPLSYDKNRQYPTVLGFHGSSSIGFFFEADTKMSEPRFSNDKIMVYPSALNGSWGGPLYSSTPLIEDLRFVDDLLDWLRQDYCVDDSRIYATGMSNGGGFVGSLACDAQIGGRFAAFAPVAGSFYTDWDGPDNGCEQARSIVPIIELHGLRDRLYEGRSSSGGKLPTIPAWYGLIFGVAAALITPFHRLASWAKRDRCAIPPRVEDSHNGLVHRTIWTCNGTAGAVQHLRVDDMGLYLSWP